MDAFCGFLMGDSQFSCFIGGWWMVCPLFGRAGVLCLIHYLMSVRWGHSLTQGAFRSLLYGLW